MTLTFSPVPCIGPTERTVWILKIEFSRLFFFEKIICKQHDVDWMHKTFWLAHMLWIVIYSQMILSNDLFCWLRNSSKGVQFTVLICLESGKQSKLHVYGAKTYFTSEMGWYSTLLLFWWQHYHQTWLPAILYSKPVHWPQVSAVAKCVRMLTIDVP